MSILHSARDERGWRIPKKWTKSWEIYHLVVAGWKSIEIIRLFGEETSRSSVRVLISRMKNPSKHNAYNLAYAQANPRVSSKIVKDKEPSAKQNDSAYVMKLVRVLKMPLAEARRVAAKELEKAK